MAIEKGKRKHVSPSHISAADQQSTKTTTLSLFPWKDRRSQCVCDCNGKRRATTTQQAREREREKDQACARQQHQKSAAASPCVYRDVCRGTDKRRMTFGRQNAHTHTHTHTHDIDFDMDSRMHTHTHTHTASILTCIPSILSCHHTRYMKMQWTKGEGMQKRHCTALTHCVMLQVKSIHLRQ